MESAFATLNRINVGEHIEKKNGLSYLAWAWAWGELLKNYPDSTYRVYENAQGWNYHTDGKTCWVKTGVTVNGKECIEMLPVMDFKNRSIPLDAVTSFDVNKAIQRSLTKAVARHGLGLYIYAGEDLPEEEQEKPAAKPEKPEPFKPQFDVMPMIKDYCEQNEMTGKEFTAARNACIEAGLLDRVAYDNMTEEQALKMLEVITLNRLNEKTA